MPPEPGEVREWLRKADNDRRTAEAALTQPNPTTDTAAFHCQQSAEKLLKAYLTFREYTFERTHDLRELIECCVECDPSFESIRDRVEPLTAYAVRFRYPGPADPAVEQVQDALEVVRNLTRFVEGRLPSSVLLQSESDLAAGVLYEDDQCAYAGGDVRFPELEQPGGRPARLEIGADCLLLRFESSPRQTEDVSFDDIRYPRASITGVAQWDRHPHFVTVSVVDPEGVLADGIPIVLKFRNEYYAAVLVKRLREAFDLPEPRSLPTEGDLPLPPPASKGDIPF